MQTFEVKLQLVGHAMGVLDLCFDKDWIVSCSKVRLSLTFCNFERSELTGLPPFLSPLRYSSSIAAPCPLPSPL
jgi:hypothetical protein